MPKTWYKRKYAKDNKQIGKNIIIQIFFIPQIIHDPIVKNNADNKTSIYIKIKILVKIFKDNKTTLLLSSIVNCSLYSMDIASFFIVDFSDSMFLIVFTKSKKERDVINKTHIFGSKSGPITASSSTIICWGIIKKKKLTLEKTI